jgi:WD40 repeat protein/serine/threonine protein kinase
MNQRRKRRGARLIDQLAAYDEWLAHGRSRGELDQPSAAAELHQRLGREVECIRLLERVWSRGSSSRSDADTDAAGASVEASPVLDRASTSQPTRLGRFEIRRPLGQGGYGVVFLAYDPTLRREVALKVPRPDTALNEDLRQRFLREARAAAGLDHPNIVPIYEAGSAGAVCFIAEAYCRGASLAGWLKARNEPVSATVAATLVASLADGVAHAHARGVLHRDLKPANVLLDIPAEVNPQSLKATTGGLGFIPRISDFGLAKLMDQDMDRTRSGVMLGTVNYMAPEQASTGKSIVAAGADIYSLGVILYELITGRPPFQGESPLEILQQVRELEAVPPTRLRQRIPRDLETICLKCLQKSPVERYASAEALAADLRRFLRREPIHARPITVPQRLWRWCRRNPALASSASLAVFALLLLATLSVSFAIYQSHANWRLSDAMERVREQYIEAERRSVVLALDRGLVLCQQGDVARGVHWLSQGLKTADSLPAAEARNLIHVLRANLAVWQTELRPLSGIFPHDFGVGSLAFSPDGGKVATCGADNCVRFRDVSTGQPVGPVLEHPAMVRSAAFSPDGTALVTGSADDVARVWETATGKLVSDLLPHQAPLRSVRFGLEVSTIFTGADDGLRRWDVYTGKVVMGPVKHEGAALAIVCLLAGDAAITACTDYKVRLWDLATGKLRVVLDHAGPVNTASASSDGRFLITCNSDNTVRLWDTRTLAPVGAPLRHPDQVIGAAYHTDGDLVLTLCADRKVRVWDVESAEEVMSPFLLLTDNFSVVFSPDAKSIVTGGSAEPARMWDVLGNQRRGLVLRHPDQVRAVAYSPDGQQALTGCRDGMARLWDLTSGNQLGPALRHDARVLAVTFSPDGKTLFTGGADNSARLWHAGTGQMLYPPLMHDDKVNSVAFSPDGRVVATAGEDNVVRFWSADSGTLLPERTLHHESAVQEVSFTPDGTRIVTSEAANIVRVWDAVTATQIGVSMFSAGRTLGSAVSSDGETVVLTSTDMKVRVWNVKTGELVGQPLAHPATARDVAFSPDGRIALTGCYDGQARLWDLAARRLVGPPLVHRANVYAVAFSPDGRSVMTGNWDNTARVWPIAAPLEAAPKSLEASLEVLTGMRLGDDGTIQWLDSDSWYRARRDSAPP